MSKYAWRAWALKNSVCIICWTVLAIVFKHWWITLFSLFFMTGLDVKEEPKKRYFICDMCGAYSPEGSTLNEAEQLRIKSGWVRRKNGEKWADICPCCQEKLGNVSRVKFPFFKGKKGGIQ